MMSQRYYKREISKIANGITTVKFNFAISAMTMVGYFQLFVVSHEIVSPIALNIVHVTRPTHFRLRKTRRVESLKPLISPTTTCFCVCVCVCVERERERERERVSLKSHYINIGLQA